MKKLTHQEFIKKLPKIDYNIEGVYINTRSKILVKDKYGLCELFPNNILKGSKSSIQSAINKNSYFINQAKEIHGDRYDYSKIVYKTNEIKIKIICTEHGEFLQQPHPHLQGQGCPKCGLKIQQTFLLSNLKDFIIKSNKVHSNLYSYENSIYLGNKIKLTITCKIHGNFEQSPNSHLRGRGCKKCMIENGGGHSRTDFEKASKGRECTLYIIKIFSDSESFYKVGITSHTVKTRFNHYNKMPYKYCVIYEQKSHDSKLLYDTEVKFKKFIRSLRYTPKIIFGGHTECFSDVNLLLKAIENKEI